MKTERELYVSSSRVLGLKERAILLRHVLPNSLEAVIANASVGIGGAVLLTAGLSFVGAGVRPPTPEWGAEIASGANYVIQGDWWIGIFPGLVLSSVVLGFALLGDAIRRFVAREGRTRESPLDPAAGQVTPLVSVESGGGEAA